MTKEQTEACEKLAEEYCGPAVREFRDLDGVPSYAASPVYNENKAYQQGFQAAQTPEMLMLNPLVKGLVKALEKITTYKSSEYVHRSSMDDMYAIRETANKALAPFKEGE